MATMRVAQISKAKGQFEIVERPIPQLAPGTVRIKMAAWQSRCSTKPARRSNYCTVHNQPSNQRRLTNEYDYNFQRKLNVAS
jgi:hypothetical protein